MSEAAIALGAFTLGGSLVYLFYKREMQHDQSPLGSAFLCFLFGLGALIIGISTR